MGAHGGGRAIIEVDDRSRHYGAVHAVGKLRLTVVLVAPAIVIQLPLPAWAAAIVAFLPTAQRGGRLAP